MRRLLLHLPAAAFLLFGLAFRGEASITVQLVNDNNGAIPDANVWVLLVGKDINASGVATRDLVNPSQVTSSQQLSSLTTNGTVTSPLTGNVLPVYEFTVTEITSAVLFVSYDNPNPSGGGFIAGSGQITYATASPTTSAPYRFDKMEFSYSTSGNSGGADLTSIDFLAIPMQIELFQPSATTASDTTTFYFSLSSILKSLTNLGAATYPPSGNFLRILGPGQIASQNAGSPAPFPSFKSYLQYAADKKSPITVKGTQGFAANQIDNQNVPQYQGTFDYTGKVASDGNGGFNIVLTGSVTDWQYPPGTAQSGPPSPIPNATSITINLPAASVSRPSMDEVIYGCALNFDTFSVSPAMPNPAINGTVTTGTSTTQFTDSALVGANITTPFNVTFTSGANNGQTGSVTGFNNGTGELTLAAALPAIPSAGDTFTINIPDETYFNDLLANSIYSWAVGDVLAGLNYGYIAGTDPTATSTDWFAALPQSFPYGQARPSVNGKNDGYYNPYAAVLYNTSDTYSFGLSDRGGAPSPLMTIAPVTPAYDRMRITVLPATQLDAPQPKVTSSTTTTINLSWAAVAGATSYSVEVYPSGSALVTGTTAVISGLNAGSPYLINVFANGAGGIQSKSIPLNTMTQGPLVPVSTSLPLAFEASINWPTPPVPAGTTVKLNGTAMTFNSGGGVVANVPLSASPGTENAYVLTIEDAKHGVYYSGSFLLGFTAGSTAGAMTFSSTPELFGSLSPVLLAANTVPPDPLGPWNSSLVIGNAFSPLSLKKYAPVFFPGTTSTAKKTQTIEFLLPSKMEFTRDAVPLHATSSSGLPVQFAVLGPATVQKDSLFLKDLGKLKVTASQAGDGAYAAAAPVARDTKVVDTKAPKIYSLKAGRDGSSLNILASDAHGVARVEYRLKTKDAAKYGERRSYKVRDKSHGRKIRIRVPLRLKHDTVYDCEAWLVDASGNESAVKHVVLDNRDGRNPVIHSTPKVTRDESGKFILTVVASDTDKLARVVYRLRLPNAAEFGSDHGAPIRGAVAGRKTVVRVPLDEVSVPGAYTIEVFVEDSVGNRSQVRQVIFGVEAL